VPGVYDLHLRSTTAKLRDVDANPKRLDATISVLTVLYTWGSADMNLGKVGTVAG